MASYGENILPTDAAFYTLTDATISGGIMTLAPNGTAVFNVGTDSLAALTEWFRVAVIPSIAMDSYSPTLFMRINARTTDGTYYNYTCTPTDSNNAVYTAEIKLKAADYIEMVVTITSTVTVSLTLWELCPEAKDADIQTIIDGVEQSLPRLLYDYNTWPLTVEQREKTIGLITCNLLDDTDLQGHFTITFTASESTTLTLRFKDNEATELFAPLYYDLHAGRSTVGVPHAYLHRLAGLHNFVVTAQVTKGSLSIGTRGMLFTIDGGYLAERVIDVGHSISDIAIEHKQSDYEPRYIWVIGVEAGEVLVRRRAYSVKATGVTFDPMFSLGQGLDGAIEFDGDWYLDEEYADVLYQLNTYDNPYCFFIDTSHNLYVQRGADESTRVLLDTSVSSVSVVRGYKSNLYPAQDQGIICLYIKNGKAWYRHYSYDNGSGVFKWFVPTQVTGTTGTVLTAQVHRLNDYRVGFAITTSTANYWLLSSRTYVAQAFKPETVFMSHKPFMTVGLYEALDVPTLTVAGDLSDDRLSVTATFNYPIRCQAYSPRNWINMPSGMIGTYGEKLDSIEINDNQLIIKVKERLLVAYTITLVSTAAWQFYYNGTWQAMPSPVSFTYDPYGHLSVANQQQGTATFSVSSTEATVNLKPLLHLQQAYNDTVVINSAADITVTQSAVARPNYNYSDTIVMNVTPSATVTLQQTGEEPI